MKKSQKKYNEIVEALKNNLGNITLACKAVRLNRTSFYEWYNEDPEFKKMVDGVDDFTLDFVENQLLKKIKEGDRASILFYMKYKGRKRGYTESITTDVNITMEQPLLEPLKKNNDE
jgi:hypothetical protein